MKPTLINTAFLFLIPIAAQILDAHSAAACSVAFPAPFDVSTGTSEPPPVVIIKDIEIELGRNYGGDGPGDCSDLGSVRIILASDDNLILDGKYGAKVNVIGGELPALVDLSEWVEPIENNQIRFTISDRNTSSVDFKITVQTVNAQNELGPESLAKSGSEEVQWPFGCSVSSHHRGSRGWWSVFLVFGWLWCSKVRL